MGTPAELASARLAHEMNSWKSIEVRTVEEQSNLIREAYVEPSSTNRYHYIETPKGLRMAEVILTSPGKPASQKASFCDGVRCANIVYDHRRGDPVQDHIDISRGFGDESMFGSTYRPMPLKFFYVGKVPLYEALPKAEYRGAGRVAGRDTELFVFAKVRWAARPLDLVYDLDKETSIPVRVRAYGDLAGKTPDDDNLVFDWSAAGVDVIQGYHVPLQSRLSTFAFGTNDPKAMKTSAQIRVESIRYNADFPKSTFWPEYQPGVPVFDAIQKKSYQAPGKKVLSHNVEANRSTAAVPAEAPRGGPSVLPSFSLGLGIAFMAIGVFLKARRTRA